jgi:hypothetical protein
MADSARIQVYAGKGAPTVIQGSHLGLELSQSLFKRSKRIRKLLVDVPEATLR